MIHGEKDLETFMLSKGMPLDNSKKINFICIGGQRCGKNTMYTWLRDHPEVSTSQEMEINFFSHYWEKGYWWYEDHFSPNQKTKAIGEMSGSYLYDKEAPNRVKQYNNDVKIIVSLRNPVGRVISHFKHSVKVGHIPPNNLNVVASIEKSPALVEFSRYKKYLSYWLDEFPAHNILVLNFDNIIKYPRETYRELCLFLEIDTGIESKNLGTIQNTSYIPRSHTLLKIITNFRILLEFIGLNAIVRLIRSMQLRRVIDKVNDSNIEVNISEEETTYLKNIFKDDWDEIKPMLEKNKIKNIGF